MRRRSVSGSVEGRFEAIVNKQSYRSPEILLFGHGELACSVLAALRAEGFRIAAVVDSEGRDGALTFKASQFNIPVTGLHPRKRRDELVQFLRKRTGESAVLLSVNYRFIIGEKILGLCDWALNVHGSLLPRYRGRTPHVWAIINGETETGVTVHVMDHGIDTGPIVTQRKLSIQSDDTGASLLERLKRLYPPIVLEAINMLGPNLRLLEQDESNATFFGKRTPEMGLIDFRLPLQKLRNFIRAIAPPYPGAFCFLPDGQKIIVRDVSVRADLSHLQLPKYSARRVSEHIVVRTDDGVLQLVPISEA